MHAAGTPRVSVDVKNTGDRSGTETVQLYIHETTGPVATPVRQLRGFERVDLKAGETKNVTLTLTPEDLQLLDRDMHWRVAPGVFEIMVGPSSEHLPLKGELTVVP
jgi:beta-glucosidase